MNLAQDLSALEETVKRCQGLVPAVEAAGRALAERVKAGSKVLTCGNGGSAADAMHLAEEMTGRYRANRKALPALSLSADGTALTCIGNDWSFEDIFSRQVEAFGQPGDVLVVFSTSGKSPNILKALEVAKGRNMLRLGALGKGADLRKNSVTTRLSCRARTLPASRKSTVGSSTPGWNVWRPLPLERLKATDFILGRGGPVG